jgi:competence protein ComEA
MRDGAGPAPDRSRPRKPGGPSRGQPPAGPVDINRASLADLTRLPGVGPALASRILQAREREGPFTSIDDLRRVRGVGPSKLERLRPHVTAGE